MWISAVIKSLMDFLSKFFSYKTVKTEHQTTTEIIKEKNKLKEASDLTEEIFWLEREYMAADSQFTMWIAKMFYDELNTPEKRLFKKFYKIKLKLKKKIEKLHKQFQKVN